jgi:glutamate racemase
VERYALENAVFLASRGIKLLVVACNTASALALPKIRETIGLDVVGVIGPGARKAANIADKIGVIATEATVSSEAYEKAIKLAKNSAEVIQTACPLFVPLAEEGWTNEPETRSIAQKYLSQINDFQPEAVVLGCTHYPILREVIQQTVGENVKLIDSGEACAEEVSELLQKENLANPNEAKGKRHLCDDLDHFYVTDAATRFAKVAERFLGAKPNKLEDVELSELKSEKVKKRG